MRRLLLYLTVLLVAGIAGAQEPVRSAPDDAPPEVGPPLPPPKSAIYTITDPAAITGYVEDRAVTQRMTERLILAATGQSDARRAWQSLVSPKDVVGIKIATTGGKYFSSHHGVVEALVSGLQQAGVPRSRIIVWDRLAADLREAGYVGRKGDYAVRSIDPPRGLDAKAVFFAPTFGKLIWGDLSFVGKSSLRDKTGDTGPDQLSPESHLPLLLTKEVTKIINVAVLSDEPGCGIAGALYNVTVPAVDNNRRFTHGSGALSLCDLYLDERIGPRVVMNVVDGLVAQYAGGPDFNPNYAHAHETLYASRDPVALDTVLVGKLEEWRKQANLPPIGARAGWLAVGEELGIGLHNRGQIEVKTAPASLER